MLILILKGVILLANILGAIFIAVGLITSIYLVKTREMEESDTYVDGQRLKTESPIERIMYDALLRRGHYIETQYPIGKYRIDIALPQYKLAIETDGHQFHSSIEQKAKDKRKDNYLRKNGWKVIRIPGWMVFKSLPRAIRIVEDEIKERRVTI